MQPSGSSEAWAPNLIVIFGLPTLGCSHCNPKARRSVEKLHTLRPRTGALEEEETSPAVSGAHRLLVGVSSQAPGTSLGVTFLTTFSGCLALETISQRLPRAPPGPHKRFCTEGQALLMGGFPLQPRGWLSRKCCQHRTSATCFSIWGSMLYLLQQYRGWISAQGGWRAPPWQLHPSPQPSGCSLSAVAPLFRVSSSLH